MTIPRLTKADHPVSFGAFKPLGHVVVALPNDRAATAAVQSLRAAGFTAQDVLEYTASEEENEMTRMLAGTGDLAGFGYEVTLMRKYQQLAHDGASWLIVYAPEDERTQQVVAAVRPHGALLAEKYNRFTVEDLI